MSSYTLKIEKLRNSKQARNLNDILKKSILKKEKPFKCNLKLPDGVKCTWRFYTSDALEKHQHTRIHCKEIQKRKTKKPHYDGIFTSYSDLAINCRYCGKYFRQSQSRDRHEKSEHTKLSRYKCGICEIDLIRCDKWKEHMMNIHGEKYVYKCDYEGCSERFQMKAELIKHRKIKHEEEEKRKII